MVELSRGKQTSNTIRQAILRIEKERTKVVAKGRKMSIAAVAEEAGVSRATIHNNYPDLAERIRATANKQARKQRDEKHDALQAEKVKNRDLRSENAELRAKIGILASKNRSLLDELCKNRAITGSRNVHVLEPNKYPKPGG